MRLQTYPLPAKSLSFTIGFLSLGTETLWIRLFSYQNHSIAKALPFILGVYLLGIAFGAAVGSRICKGERHLGEILAVSLLYGAAAISFGPATVTASLRFGLNPNGFATSLAFLAAFAFSVCFPICHHLGTIVRSGSTGKSMSKVYAANIAGSVIGPLFVNFVLLQFGTTQLAFTLLGLLTAAVALAVLLICPTSNYALKLTGLVGVLIATASVFAAAGPNNWLIANFSSDHSIRRIIETRQGIAVSLKEDVGGDVILGGNVYDGRTNVDPRINSNGINRVLVLAALRPNPKRILMLGLSIGTWNYLVTGFPGVQQIDVVEINPGYIDMIQDYPEQRTALGDPRVKLTIADGRKFLRTVPESTYDLVVINTTFHWRSYISLLLSREFLTLVRTRMTRGALLAFNATGSPDALNTAASVFPYAYLYDNFVFCGDFDWRTKLDEQNSVDELLRVSPEGKPLLTMADKSLVLNFLSRDRTTTVAEATAKAGRPLEVITDRNLITEYKYGMPLFGN
jgi:predicted membrane-bound spermidine synthase